ncbi:MAG: sulfurtransferase [Bacteroidales bacterium]|nr:sulfurtransferase [Bacteroidales bacterium]
MKTYKNIIAAFMALMLIGSGLKAQDVCNVKELLAGIKAKTVVVVAAEKPEDYSKSHIPGSVNIFHKDLYAEGAIESVIKSDAELAKIFGEKGLTADSKIVIYDAGSAKYSGRLYWILKYMGAKDVKILDGNLNAWKMARRPVTNKVTEITATTFTPNVNASILCDMAAVMAAQNSASTVILDVRADNEYKGLDEKSKLRKGHIPSSVNIEFKQVMTDKGLLKSKEELTKLFADAGITADKQVILYCASSVRAGVVYMALTTALDFKNVKVYDGAFNEWSASNNKVVI